KLPNSEKPFRKHLWPPRKLGCSCKLSNAPRTRPGSTVRSHCTAARDVSLDARDESPRKKPLITRIALHGVDPWISIQPGPLHGVDPWISIPPGPAGPAPLPDAMWQLGCGSVFETLRQLVLAFQSLSAQVLDEKCDPRPTAQPAQRSGQSGLGSVSKRRSS